MKIESGYGCYCVSEGRDYLDFTSGIFEKILGNDLMVIFRDVLTDTSIVGSYGHTNPWTERYKDMLKEFTGFESVSLFTTGSEATEAFWRAMRIHNGKTPIWGGLVDPDNVGNDDAEPDAMHGVTLGALVMAGKLKDVYGLDRKSTRLNSSH